MDRIGWYAFRNCTALTAIELPATLTWIGECAFQNCTALTNVIYDGTRAKLNSITEASGNEALLNNVVCGVLHLPQKLTAVGPQALAYTAAEWIICPSGLKTIGALAFADSCLKRIELPASVTSIAENAFDGCGTVRIVAPAGSYAAQYAQSHGMPLTAR